MQRPAVILALAAYSLASTAMTWPLALHAGDHLLATDSNALNDTYFSIWIFGWQARQWIADPLHLFQGNIFYPFPNTLAFSEIIVPGAWLYLPFEYATANPILAYNLVVILSFILNGLTTYLWAWDELARGDRRGATVDGADKLQFRVVYGPAFLAGLVFGFCTYKLGEIRHIQLLMAMFMPLTLMYLRRLVSKPNLRHAFLTSLFFALNALSSLYYAVFLTIALALYVGVDFFVRRYRLTRAHVTYAVIAIALAAIILLPLMIPFIQVEREFHFTATRDPVLYAARPAGYLAATANHWLYGRLTRGFYVAAKGQPLFPGLVALALASVGLVALIRQQNRLWIFLLLLALVGFILSFGPVLVLDRSSAPALPFPLPYYYLSLVLTPLKSLNAPARFAVLVMLALALFGAFGARTLMQRLPRGGGAVFGACALLILAEYAPVPLRLAPVAVGAHISPVYRFLAAQPPGQPIVELPMGEPTFAGQDKYVVYAYHSLYHRQPLLNGYSTFIPPKYYALVKAMLKFPTRGTVKRLRRWGAKWVVIHSDRYPDAIGLRRQLDALDGIEHVQDFGEIWLYRIAGQ